MVAMELVQELLVTASFAFLISFLIAKLISTAMGYDPEANEKVDFIDGDAKEVKPNQSSRVKLRTLDMESISSQNPSSDEDYGFIDASKGEGKAREDAKGKVEVEKFEGGKEEGLINIDDDWEGIERSELERDFAAATSFVGEECGTNSCKLRRINSDVEMQLCGLQKVATQGRCHEPQPQQLTFSALAKWNAWQRLGNMSSEEAMERYVGLLSNAVPGWMEDHSLGKVRSDAADVNISDESDHDSSSCLSYEPISENQRELEMEHEYAATGNAMKVKHLGGSLACLCF